MSYSLYTYLKENPRLNGPKVNYNWSALLSDDNVPASVKAELNELIKHKIVTLTDAVLFWSDYVMLQRMCDEGKLVRTHDGKYKTAVHEYPIYPDAFSSQFALMCYSYFQLEPEKADAKYIYDTVFAFDAERELFCMFTDWTIDKIRQLCELKQASSRYSSLRNNRFARCYLENEYVDDKDCRFMCTLFDESFMSRITTEQLIYAKQLISDCDKPTVKFKSMNDIERAHDARTEREVIELSKKGATRLIYHPDFTAVAEKYGFTLPPTNISMIARGKQHNNCVATYYDKHTKKVAMYMTSGDTETLSRIFFTDTATLELIIEYSKDCIVSTTMQQFKGRFNKDATRNKQLIAFRIALVGMPKEVLEVRRMPDV
jgi:hypothetical protein